MDFLASVIVNDGYSWNEEVDDGLESTSACDEALNILHSLPISEGGLLDLVTRHAGMIESLRTILKRSSYRSRAYATLLLRSMLGVLSS